MASGVPEVWKGSVPDFGSGVAAGVDIGGAVPLRLV